MTRKRFFYKLPVIQMSLTILLVLSFGLIFYLIYCKRKSNTYVTFVQKTNEPISKDCDLYMIFSVENNKWWELENHTFGAQYDGKFFNNTNHSFTDWTITAKVPKGYWVDSTWNADFSYKFTDSKPIPLEHVDSPEYKRQYRAADDEIIMKKNPSSSGTVVNGKNKTDGEPFMIGMIMYTPHLCTISDIEITGRFIYEPSDSILFLILIAGIVISFVTFAVLVIIRLAVINEIKYYEVRQKLDSDIIVQSFKTFANFVDAKDPYTKGHSLRVAHYAREIARRLNLSPHEQMEIFWLGLMHDVGKISISDQILKKPSKLTPEEFAEIRSHVTTGFEMLKDFTAMPMLKEVAKSHHEHWDGNGYCEHLKGLEIPLEARIVCACDSFDAMNSDRCYRKKLPKDEIRRQFEIEAGKHFDPKIAKLIISMIDDKFVDKIENIDTTNDINYKA